MHHFEFKELSFKIYRPITIEVIGGSRPRLTLEHKQARKKYFLKTYRHNPREIWAEMLASRLGLLAGIEVQTVSLKKIPAQISSIFRQTYRDYLPKSWRPVGALVTNVFPKNHEQLYGSQIIGTASDPISLQHVEEAVRSRYLDSDDILQAFSDMIVFDAWIGNMDRHHENWAITQTSIAQQMSMFSLPKDERERLKKKRWFTQLYDHGSSLLFELGEEKVRYYLEHQEQFVKDYILGKKYALLLGVNDKEMNIFDIIQQNIENKTNWSKRLKKSIAKICAVDSLKVAQAIMQMPTDGLLAYSADRKSLLYLSLEKRREILRGMI